MKLLSAVLDKGTGDLTLSILMDEEALIDDPTWVRPTTEVEEAVPVVIEREGDGVGVVEPKTLTRTVPIADSQPPQVPDPAAIRVLTYGAGPRQDGETKNAYERRLDDHVKSSLREARLLLREDARKARRAEERAEDPAETEVVALLAEPVDLETAELRVGR